jgi:hypothetical protein
MVEEARLKPAEMPLGEVFHPLKRAARAGRLKPTSAGGAPQAGAGNRLAQLSSA